MDLDETKRTLPAGRLTSLLHTHDTSSPACIHMIRQLEKQTKRTAGTTSPPSRS